MAAAGDATAVAAGSPAVAATAATTSVAAAPLATPPSAAALDAMAASPGSAADEEQYALDRIFDIAETEPVPGKSHGLMAFRVKVAHATEVDAAARLLQLPRGVLVKREALSCAVQCWKESFPYLVKLVNHRTSPFLPRQTAAPATASATSAGGAGAASSGAAATGAARSSPAKDATVSMAEEDQYAIKRLFDIMETVPVPGTQHGVMTFRVQLARKASLEPSARYLERVRGVLVTREAVSHSCFVRCWKASFPFLVKHINQSSWGFLVGRSAAGTALEPAATPLAASEPAATPAAAGVGGAAAARSAGAQAGAQAVSTPSSPLQASTMAEEEQYTLDRVFHIAETVPLPGKPHGVMTFRVTVAPAAELEAAAGYLERVRGVRVTRDAPVRSCAVQCWKESFPYLVKHINQRRSTFVAA